MVPVRTSLQGDLPPTSLVALRLAAGWTQDELAARLGVATPTICHWESGAFLPRLDRALALCHLFDVTPEELLAGQLAVREQCRREE